MRTRFDRWARAYGMTRAQGMILARLDRQPGLSQNEMAALCEVEPITVGRLVDRLEARGLAGAPRRPRRPAHTPAASAAGGRADPEGDPALQGRPVARITDGLDAADACEIVTDALLHMKTQLTMETAERDARGGRRIECPQSTTPFPPMPRPRQSWARAVGRQGAAAPRADDRGRGDLPGRRRRRLSDGRPLCRPRTIPMSMPTS